jgi:gliding motility-associated protein GldE
MNGIQISTLNFELIMAGIASVLLLIISGIIASAEVAFFSLSQQAMHELENSGSITGQKIRKLNEQPQRLLATILVSSNLANISFIVLMAYATSFLAYYIFSPITLLILQTIIITFLVLLFAEVLPKIYASQKAIGVTLKTASFIYFLSQVFSPAVNLLVNSTSIVNSRLARHQRRNISRDELSQALELTSDSSDEDKEMLEGIIRFGDKRVVDIMTSRTAMVDIDLKINFKQLLDKIIEVGYSRIPVYSDSRDNIKGILYAKDLLPHLDKQSNFRWQSLIRSVFYVPETKMIDDLLSDFQLNKVHLAIVVDEYGGTSGLVTLEDILEEIVGDISDEYDDEEKLFTKIDNHTYVFEAKIQLNDFFKIDEIDEQQFSKISGDVETLAGLILEIKGEIPAKNERFDYGLYVFEIMAVDNRRIKKVKVHIKNDPRKEEE